MANLFRSFTESERGDPNLVEGFVSGASLSGTMLLEYKDQSDAISRFEGGIDKALHVVKNA